MNTSTHRWELLGKFSLVSWINSTILLDISLFKRPRSSSRKEEGRLGYQQTQRAQTHCALDAPLCLPSSHHLSATTGDKSFYFIKPQHMIRSICPVWVFLLFYEGSSLWESSNIPFRSDILGFHKCPDGLAQCRPVVHAPTYVGCTSPSKPLVRGRSLKPRLIFWSPPSSPWITPWLFTIIIPWPTHSCWCPAPSWYRSLDKHAVWTPTDCKQLQGRVFFFFGKLRGLKWREKTEMVSEPMLVARSAWFPQPSLHTKTWERSQVIFAVCAASRYGLYHVMAEWPGIAKMRTPAGSFWPQVPHKVRFIIVENSVSFQSHGTHWLTDHQSHTSADQSAGEAPGKLPGKTFFFFCPVKFLLFLH